MSPRATHLLLLLAMFPAALRAGETKPTPEPYQLKKRSAFSTLGEEQRAPFWPIGWVKRRAVATAAAPAAQVEQPKIQFDTSGLKLTSILIGTPSLAIINGRSYSEGDFLRQPRVATPAAALLGSAPRVRVYRINDGNVVLQNQQELITIALQRPELVQRSSAEDLLTEDRP